MRSSVLLTAAAATLATTSPTTYGPPKTTNAFQVSNFVFGCTVGCDWSFDLSVKGKSPNHPEVKKPVKCSGNLDNNKDYVECGKVSNTQTLYAYIVKEDNTLKLQYEVQKPKEGAVYRYTGEKTVYAATGDNAALQKPNFKVPETGATGVA